MCVCVCVCVCAWVCVCVCVCVCCVLARALAHASPRVSVFVRIESSEDAMSDLRSEGGHIRHAAFPGREEWPHARVLGNLTWHRGRPLVLDQVGLQNGFSCGSAADPEGDAVEARLHFLPTPTTLWLASQPLMLRIDTILFPISNSVP
jgi:hypothetical protein